MKQYLLVKLKIYIVLANNLNYREGTSYFNEVIIK